MSFIALRRTGLGPPVEARLADECQQLPVNVRLYGEPYLDPDSLPRIGALPQFRNTG